MKLLLLVGICGFLSQLAISEADRVCGEWETLEPCSWHEDEDSDTKTCMHPAERKCTVMDADGNADRIEYEIKDDVMCDDEECDDDEGNDDEGEDDDADDEALEKAFGDDAEDKYEELNTGEEFCVSDCEDEYSFLANYQTGLALNEQELCQNNLTATIGGRGGEGCRVDDWFIVEECNEDCYEFGWRASYPTYCDVEDVWLWCCPPKIETTPATVCGEHDMTDVPCMVTAYRNIIDDITIMWIDADGNDLAEVSGYEVSRQYKIQDDKLLSVLTVNSWAIEGSSVVVTCKVSIAGEEDDEDNEEPCQINKFEVEVHDENGQEYSHHRVGSDAMLTCTGVGADSDDEGYVFSWYSFDENGDRVPEDSFTVSKEDGQWVSVITIPAEKQVIGSQNFQCVLEHTQYDDCGKSKSTSDDDTGTLIVWDVTDDTYCAHPGDEAVLTFTVLGTNEQSSADDGIIESLKDGTMITTETTFKDGFLMTITRNEENEILVMLTISPNMTEEVGSEFFITYLGEDGKEGVEPNLELNVMELTGGAEPRDGDTEEGEDSYVATAEVEGGMMDSPVWIDDDGRVYRLGTNEDGVEVTLSEDKTMSTITIPEEVARRLDIERVSITTRLFSESGTYCRRQKVEILIGVEERCLPKWDVAVCDGRVSCGDYTQERTWSCYCGDSIVDQSECEAPEETLTFTCPATAEFKLSPWDEDECDREECYPYPMQKERVCYCEDGEGDHADETGVKCGGEPLTQLYYCDATKPWVVGDWQNGECAAESCFDSETVDTRGCYCDGQNDRSKCPDDDLVRGRDCPATRDFEWGPWGPEICDIEERCYPSEEVKTRTCTCSYYGEFVTDNSLCEGDSEDVYSCDANLPWHPEERGDPCEDSDEESCYAFTAMQRYRCVCEHGNILEIDDDEEMCGAEPTPVRCAANKPFEWSDWVPVSECSLCYPELDQSLMRTCTCGDKEDPTRCPGSASSSQACPAPRDRVWLPTEWNELPCGDLSCHSETFTTRTRDCECDGNKDNSRCDEDLTGVLSCGFAPFILSEWSDDQCDEPLCHEYTKNKTRSCVCEDNEGSSVDLEKCEVGEMGYSEEFYCEGDSYEWGEWQSRGCPQETCYATKTKRYRICSCHGDVDFNSCPDGNAIEFYDCPATKDC